MGVQRTCGGVCNCLQHMPNMPACAGCIIFGWRIGRREAGQVPFEVPGAAAAAAESAGCCPPGAWQRQASWLTLASRKLLLRM